MVNAYFLVREIRNAVALRELELVLPSADLVDFLGIGMTFIVIFLSMSEAARQTEVFLIVSALACGLTWYKLLGFVAGLHLKLALYTKTMFHIERALRSFIVILALILGAFANMIFVILTPNPSSDLVSDSDFEGNSQFYTAYESFLTLFSMMLGEFDRDWFRGQSNVLSGIAMILFVLYMVLVFLILLNVLIAIVCDNYDFALIKARELFLLSRLHLVAGLELDGFTHIRPELSNARKRQSSTFSHQSSPQPFWQHHDSTEQQHNSPSFTWTTTSSNIGKYLSYKLLGTPWHRMMRRLLAIHSTSALFEDSTEADRDDWQGRTKHLEKQINAIVEERVVASEKRLLYAFDLLAAQQSEVMELMHQTMKVP